MKKAFLIIFTALSITAFAKPKTKTFMKKLTISSEGTTIAALLRSPKGSENKKLPLIIIVPSWTNVKEQFASIYGERLTAVGYHTLVFDFRFFGESDGQPRNYEDPESKIKDIKNIVSYSTGLPNVDKDNIYVLGVCAGAGYAARAASEMPEIKKLILVAAWLHDSEAVKAFYGGEEGVSEKIAKAQQARKKYETTGVVDYVPKVSKTDPGAAMFGDFGYYLDPSRGAIKQWQADQFAVMSWDRWLTFSPLPAAKKIECPLLMIHADGAVLPDYARKFFNEVSSKSKQLHWTEGTQFDFYDQEKQVTESTYYIKFFLENAK